MREQINFKDAAGRTIERVHVVNDSDVVFLFTDGTFSHLTSENNDYDTCSPEIADGDAADRYPLEDGWAESGIFSDEDLRVARERRDAERKLSDASNEARERR